MKWFFWTIPILLFFAQLIFTLNSQTQIRYEDLAESVRNVFWLEQGRVYDGVSTNVGWYGTLLIIYKLFGFYLHGAQFFKLALYVISMVCLGLMLRKYVRHFWLPWLVIGLSPTMLYYNTIQASHGIDLLYFPIVLFLILQKSYIRVFGWLIAMIAWMSYPTFIFYLPALVFFHLRGVLGSLVAFLTPLALAALFIKNRSTLFYDPQINSGIFRGAGNFSFDSISSNLGGVFTDLFGSGSSYHFDLNLGEFSLIFPIISLWFMVYGLWFILKQKGEVKSITWLVLISLSAALIIPSFTRDPSGAPGIRRFTPVLAAFYALFIMAWKEINKGKGERGKGKGVALAVLGLLLVHHIIAFPINLAHLKDPSPTSYPIWFNTAETPVKSLDNLVTRVQKEDLKLVCDGYCRISEVYAAIAGSCVWNKLDCKQISGWDQKTGQLIPLNPDLWDSYYFEH